MGQAAPATEQTPAAELSVNAFAAHLGVRPGVVRKGISTGRLERSLGQNAHGQTVITDLPLAEEEWRANRTGAKRKGPGMLTIAEERRRLTRAQARKVELANRREAGALIPARAAEIRYSTMVVTAKTKIRGVPSRVKQRIPHLTVDELGIIAALLDEALEELASG
jgi:hypothetical protein